MNKMRTHIFIVLLGLILTQGVSLSAGGAPTNSHKESSAATVDNALWGIIANPFSSVIASPSPTPAESAIDQAYIHNGIPEEFLPEEMTPEVLETLIFANRPKGRRQSIKLGDPALVLKHPVQESVFPLTAEKFQEEQALLAQTPPAPSLAQNNSVQPAVAVTPVPEEYSIPTTPANPLISAPNLASNSLPPVFNQPLALIPPAPSPLEGAGSIIQEFPKVAPVREFVPQEISSAKILIDSAPAKEPVKKGQNGIADSKARLVSMGAENPAITLAGWKPEEPAIPPDQAIPLTLASTEPQTPDGDSSGPLHVSGESKNWNERFYQALEDYVADHTLVCRDILLELQQQAQSERGRIQTAFWLGECAMASKEFEAARGYYSQVLDSRDYAWRPQATHKLGMCNMFIQDQE